MQVPLRNRSRPDAANTGIARGRAAEFHKFSVRERNVFRDYPRRPISPIEPFANGRRHVPENHVIIERQRILPRKRANWCEFPGDALRHAFVEMWPNEFRNIALCGAPDDFRRNVTRTPLRFRNGDCVHQNKIVCARSKKLSRAVHRQPQGFKPGRARIADRPADTKLNRHARAQQSYVNREWAASANHVAYAGFSPHDPIAMFSH